jgi:Na+/H+ antiporter NhaA
LPAECRHILGEENRGVSFSGLTGASSLQPLGVSLLFGIGFMMSLIIGLLAFADDRFSKSGTLARPT